MVCRFYDVPNCTDNWALDISAREIHRQLHGFLPVSGQGYLRMLNEVEPGRQAGRYYSAYDGTTSNGEPLLEVDFDAYGRRKTLRIKTTAFTFEQISAVLNTRRP